MERIAWWDERKTCRENGKALGIKSGNAYLFAKYYRLKWRRLRDTPVRWNTVGESIRRMRKAGLEMKEIASVVGLDVRRVYRVLSRSATKRGELR